MDINQETTTGKANLKQSKIFLTLSLYYILWAPYLERWELDNADIFVEYK